MLKLKFQYFVHLMQRANSLEKTLMLGKIEGRRRRGQQGMRLLDGITDSVGEFEQTPGDSEGQGSLACCSPWGLKKSNTTEQLNNNNIKYFFKCLMDFWNKLCFLGCKWYIKMFDKINLISYIIQIMYVMYF